MKGKTKIKADGKFDFDIYEVETPSWFGNKRFIVLANNVEKVISTVPNAVSIKKISGTIVINKDVAKTIGEIRKKNTTVAKVVK